VTALAQSLGLDKGSPNPTVRGRTWLCQWPVVEAVGEDGTRMRNDWALVVASPKAILLPGAQLTLKSAWDLEDDCCDVFCCELSTNALRLNEEQRCIWGPALHQIGRVYWMVETEQEEKPAKPKKPRKPKPEPPEPE
jgi:hypothetical protein